VQRVFSHSSLSAYETCPKKYQFRYVLKVPVETEGIEAFVGKRVHEVLERLYQFTARGMVPSLARVLARFRANWAEQFVPERTRIVRSELAPEDYQRSGERCLENAYRRLYPFDDETVGLSARSRSPRRGGRYPVRGVIDRLVRRDGALEIHDYKTAACRPRTSSTAIASWRSTRSAPAPCSRGGRGAAGLALPAPNRRAARARAEQLDALREETRAAIDRIRGETAWEARPGKLCAWCEYRPLCPAFGAVTPPAPPPPDLEPEESYESQLSLW
jgi:putative RecB family exonuclease